MVWSAMGPVSGPTRSRSIKVTCLIRFVVVQNNIQITLGAYVVGMESSTTRCCHQRQGNFVGTGCIAGRYGNKPNLWVLSCCRAMLPVHRVLNNLARP